MNLAQLSELKSIGYLVTIRNPGEDPRQLRKLQGATMLDRPPFLQQKTGWSIFPGPVPSLRCGTCSKYVLYREAGLFQKSIQCLDGQVVSLLKERFAR